MLHVLLHLLGQVVVHCATTEVHLVIDVILAILSVDHICKISATLHIVAIHIIRVVVQAVSLVANNSLLEPKLVGKRDLRKAQKNLANTFAVALLELIGRHI